MVTIETLILPSAEFGEQQTIDSYLVMSGGQHPRFRRKLTAQKMVNTFSISGLTTEEVDDLLELLESEYNNEITITTETLGTFNCLLLQDPLQVVHTRRCGYDVTFKGLVV